MLWPVMSRGGLDRVGISWLATVCLLLLQCLVGTARAGFISTYENCLSEGIRNSNPRRLQFDPKFFHARFDVSDPNKSLNITIYGNVLGQQVLGSYPPPNDPSWSNPNSTFGKIVNVSSDTNVYTTLFEQYQFLSYDASTAPPTQFCRSTINSSCPVGPSFNGNNSDPYSWSAFTVTHDMNSSFSLATIVATIRIKSGEQGAPDIACVQASLTPDIGARVAGLLRYLPVVVLIFVGLATLAAGILSPWGTSDPFKWTTNYGRDQDLLRLVTPGFADCLHYIQFVFLTATLSLNYPGFYQPATSQFAWSSLVFEQSFLTRGPPARFLVDGLYSTNNTLGMTDMTQLVGMSSRQDLWPGLMVWLAVICLAAIVLCQLAFVLRWVYFRVSKTSAEDLRQKNWPLTFGMIVRVVLNFFLLPIVAISMFQFLITPGSRLYITIIAAVVIVAILLLVAWIVFVIYSTKPRALLFDDLPTLLLYGSLYNTYSDERAPFALVLVALTFMRGIAIGAIQATGIAQIIILAICEVVFILMVNAFRPFASPTHMNLMHTIFAVVRLITLLMMVAFLPTLGVSEASRGWVGYVILLMHAIVLVFGYFLNAIQTLVEVFARLAGAGGDSAHGAQRGALISYGWRQLKNKQPNKALRPKSLNSDAAILADTDPEIGRTRSLSASSRLLLGNQRMSNHSSVGDLVTTPGYDDSIASPTSNQQSQIGPGKLHRLSQNQIVADPYYRPPRARRATLETNATLDSKHRTSTSGDWGTQYDAIARETEEELGQTSKDGAATAFLQHQRGASDQDVPANPAAQTDYAVREVDFYYGVKRGPALNSLSTRKRKTGPADPVGPVSNATSWLQRLMGGQKKDKTKGFEVVRSARAPPDQTHAPIEEEGEELQTSPPIHYQPYHDSPDPHSDPPSVREPQAEQGSSSGETIDAEPTTTRGRQNSKSGQEQGGDASAATPFLKPIPRSGTLRMEYPAAVKADDPTGQDADEIAGVTGSLAHAPPMAEPPVPRKSSRRASSRDPSIDPVLQQHQRGHRRQQSSLGAAPGASSPSPSRLPLTNPGGPDWTPVGGHRASGSVNSVGRVESALADDGGRVDGFRDDHAPGNRGF